MKCFLVMLFIILFVLSIACEKSPTQTGNDTSIALINFNLIDGTGGDPLTNAVLIIDKGIITAVGRTTEINIPDNCKIINLNGSIALPGFINTHVHNGYNKSILKAWVEGGITTVRDLGANPKNPLFLIRNEVLNDPQYARLVAAGPMITVPNGYPMVPWNSSSGLIVTSSQDAKQKTSQLIDDGADIIKIAIESGSNFRQRIPTLSLEEAKAIVEIAHEKGIVVSAHVLSSFDLKKALDAGVDDIAHMISDPLTEELAKKIVADSVYWVPTLELWHGVGENLGNMAINNLRCYVQTGGKVALGTDYAGYNSYFDLGMVIREINWMHDAGMTPMQIIVAATKNAAEVCNLKDELGTLEVGKIADIIIVTGDPLKDINVLKDVQMVIHYGKIIKNNFNSSFPKNRNHK